MDANPETKADFTKSIANEFLEQFVSILIFIIFLITVVVLFPSWRRFQRECEQTR